MPSTDATSPAAIMQRLTTAPDIKLAELAARIITEGPSMPLFARNLCWAADQILLARALRMIASTAAKRGDSKVTRLASAGAAHLEAEAMDHVDALRQ